MRRICLLPAATIARILFVTLLFLAVSTLFFVVDAWGQDTVLFTFSGGNDGAIPEAYSTSGVLVDKSGNLFGAVADAGANGCGAIYELARQPSGRWTESSIYSFQCGPDGAGPYGSLRFDKDGNLYGIAGGGTGELGVVYKLTPSPGGAWTETVLFSFGPGTVAGYNPVGVISDGSGHYFGTTYSGGEAVAGNIYELTQSGSGWTETVLYALTGGTDGDHPDANLTLGADGTLYGTAVAGGDVKHCRPPGGCGLVFQLTPNRDGTWTYTVIYAFTGGRDGHNPQAEMILDGAGNLYGTTVHGGGGSRCSDGCGTVFELSPSGSGTWTETVLYRFQGSADGEFPHAPLTMDESGSLYGTTYGGGADGNGTVFKLTQSGGAWKKTVVHDFAGGLGNDGANPYAGVAFDKKGNLYGTTAGGLGYGNVFQLPAGNAEGGAR